MDLSITDNKQIFISRVYETLKILRDDKRLFEEDEYLDVRVNINPEGDINILFGDSQFDTDHRGLWAYGSININYDDEFLLSVAKDLVNEIEDQFYY